MNFWQRLKLGIKKLGPTAKVAFWITVIGSLIGLSLALYSAYFGATKSNQDKGVEKILSAQDKM